MIWFKGEIGGKIEQGKRRFVRDKNEGSTEVLKIFIPYAV